jgi:hypothetical protein
MAVDSALRDNLPESDPAYPILAGILGIVPVSDWTYNRTSPNGDVLEPLASPDESGGTPVAADRSRRPANGFGAGPRIGPAVDVPVEFAGGVTLVFADERARYAVLTLFRTAALGPFTSAEISVLTFALDALSDRLSALRLAPAQRHPTLDNRAPAASGAGREFGTSLLRARRRFADHARVEFARPAPRRVDRPERLGPFTGRSGRDGARLDGGLAGRARCEMRRRRQARSVPARSYRADGRSTRRIHRRPPQPLRAAELAYGRRSYLPYLTPRETSAGPLTRRPPPRGDRPATVYHFIDRARSHK